MVRCENCGAESPDTNAFCDTCGETLVTAAATANPTRRCPDCGDANPEGNAFCSSCGAAIPPDAKRGGRKKGFVLLSSAGGGAALGGAGVLGVAGGAGSAGGKRGAGLSVGAGASVGSSAGFFF